jgi:hypothetical protein
MSSWFHFDKQRRIWMDRYPQWRHVRQPITSETALVTRKPLKSELVLPPPSPATKS